MFTVTKFHQEDAISLADFLNDLHQNHWSLTSAAYRREPSVKPPINPADLIAEDLRSNRIGTYLLRDGEKVVSMLQIDDKFGDGRVAVFSGVETHPDYQRHGTFWRYLGNRYLREMCEQGFERLEAITWVFNRKGIPLYKRVGFRAVPGTSLVMENYLPVIIRHPNLRDFFERHDFIRTLQCRRSYGFDGHSVCHLNLFTYHWRAGDEELKVRVDWERKQIVSIEMKGWRVWCFVREETPHCVYYYLENGTRRDLPYRAQIRIGPQRQQALLRRLAGGAVLSGHFRVSDPQGNPVENVAVDFEIDGVRVPFVLKRSKEGREMGMGENWRERLAG